MKQPELGKKIAELRKAKGLTQEELVEKCNINVRTLQRIEAGDATPRSYTIKTIFPALDYNIYDSALYGRVTYKMMEAYWPTAGEQPNASRHDKEYSIWFKRIQRLFYQNN
jgi:transcriptional regulator with XRE-family HTH domain